MNEDLLHQPVEKVPFLGEGAAGDHLFMCTLGGAA